MKYGIEFVDGFLYIATSLGYYKIEGYPGFRVWKKEAYRDEDWFEVDGIELSTVHTFVGIFAIINDGFYEKNDEQIKFWKYSDRIPSLPTEIYILPIIREERSAGLSMVPIIPMSKWFPRRWVTIKTECKKFFDTIPSHYLEAVEGVNYFKKNKHFNLLKEFSRNEKFYELFKANRGLAFYYFSTGNHFNLKEEILYKELLNKNQKEIGHSLGFRPSEVSLLKKISIDLLSEYLIRMLIDVVRNGKYAKIFSHLKEITLITVFFLSYLYDKNSKAIPTISFLDDQELRYGCNFRLNFIFDERFNFLEFQRGNLHGFEMYVAVHERFPSVRFKSIDHFLKFHDKLDDEIGKNPPKKIFIEPKIPWQGNLFIQPILNDAILYEEGCVQKNCCFDYVKKIEDGYFFFFKVLYPMRATLAIMKQGNYWIFSEIKAKRNRRVFERTWQYVKSWLDENNIYY